MLDQFYWAERMFWLGVAPAPLKRNHLLPDENDDLCPMEAANMLVRAINHALAPEVKARATEIAEILSREVVILNFNLKNRVAFGSDEKWGTIGMSYRIPEVFFF